jgi:hypothetical protein
LWAEFFEFLVHSEYESHIGWLAGKDFLPFCGVSLESTDTFFCRSALAWCGHICLFYFIGAEPFEFCLGCCSLYQYVPVYFLLLPGFFQRFRLYIKVFDPLWIDFGTEWKTGI